EVNTEITGIHRGNQPKHLVGGEIDVVLNREAYTVFFRNLYGLGKHAGEPLQLRFMRLFPEHQAAADDSHNVCPNRASVFDAGHHLVKSTLVRSTLQSIRMTPGVHAVHPISVKRLLYAG